MKTATVERIQQEYQENITDKIEAWLTNKNIGHCGVGKGVLANSDQCFYERGLIETRDLAAVSAKAAGLEKEADRMSHCGKSFSFARCTKCGECIGHPYHCDERLCPTCYYRNLARFMYRHRNSWDPTRGFLIVTMDYGSYRYYQVDDGMAYAKTIHQELLTRSPLLRGGVYHIELVWDEEYHYYHILYHYMVNGDSNHAFLFAWAVDGNARLHDYQAFNDYNRAEGYFIRRCCQYPANILLDYTKVAWYLGLMKRRKLIQGFGEFYRMSGGLNRGSHGRSRRKCPACGGKLSYVGLTTGKYVVWDNKLKCYTVDPAAPVLRGGYCDR
ncbi:hypothetical protein ES708_02383 [subsurface metagenome]